jgi:RNA polymerase sigma-70 factor, ECF subfamily
MSLDDVGGAISSPASEAELKRAFELGRTGWPAVELGALDFANHVRRHGISTNVPIGILQDIFLACACGCGIPGALQRFRERFFSVVATAVRSFDASPQFADEVYQRLSEALFVPGPSGEAKIHRYNGHGPLAGFVRTSARRIALRFSAALSRFQGEEALIEQFSQASVLDATLAKLECRDAVNRALSVALRQLPRRDRLILRMNLIEKVSTTRLAAMYKVSQPTVSRWIQRTAKAIHATVKELVCDELDIDTHELDSLLLLVRSQIEITISQGSAMGTPSSS